ncbi:MAG: Gfo/Idh/MocA family oxidoreductase [Verrucomicrobia bacterium]|nr:Gfo/Idh/MocA family oxidoreductase [Verrucomicrobiota bacterium]
MAKAHLNRRRFISTTSGLAGGAFFVPNILRSQNGEAPSNKLRIASIGVGGKGESDSNAASDGNDIVAIVDVDQNTLNKAKQKYAGAEVFTDYRKMFEAMGDKIDAVTVSTPDHTHFPAAMMAVALKKHVMVQKPMCNYIAEVRQLHQAAKAAGVVTQMGNQGRTMEGQRRAKEWIDQGAIGTLKEIRLWTNRPIWPQGLLKKQVVPQPENLNWDNWLGVEPSEPYFEFDLSPEDANKAKKGKSVHPFNWRGWWSYGSGALGDMGCHIMDATFSILHQAIPVKIEVETSPISDTCAPVWSILKYHIAATDKHPALVVSWHDGIKDGKPNKPEPSEFMNSELGQKAFSKAGSGMMFIGTDGVVFEGEAYCSSPSIYPEAKFMEVKQAMTAGTIKKTETRSPKPGEPQKEWTHVIKNGGTTSSNFDYAAPLAEFVLLGNLAIRSRQTIVWDKEKMKVTNAEAPNQFIKRPSYRPEWYKA